MPDEAINPSDAPAGVIPEPPAQPSPVPPGLPMPEIKQAAIAARVKFGFEADKIDPWAELVGLVDTLQQHFSGVDDFEASILFRYSRNDRP